MNIKIPTVTKGNMRGSVYLILGGLIVTLGRFSLARFFPGESISRARGKVRQKDGRLIYPVMHPAAALHRQDLRPSIIQDFKAIPGILENLQRAPVATSPAPEPPSPPAKQLSLFE